MLLLRKLEHQSLAVAHSIHGVQMLAYAQEAVLIGVSYFPPLGRTVQDVMGSSELFIGAFEEDELVGAVSLCHNEEKSAINIASLVVHPKHQRRGIGLQLLRYAIDEFGSSAITVQTAAANKPAVSLYAHCGFDIYHRLSVEWGAIEMIKLIRKPAELQDLA